MTFINLYILFGLGGISIPVIIHLFNRRKAKVIEWGAMRFLLGSLISRKRRVLVEEIILMALRCLLVAALVLAISRPFSPVQPGISWLILLPLILGATILLATTTIMARDRRWQWALYASVALLVVSLVTISQWEEVVQSENWQSVGKQDVAIVIDGSSSMRLLVEGKSNFQRAVDEARGLIQSLGPDDAVTIVVAGGRTDVRTPIPVSVRGNIDEILEDLQPQGGPMSTLEAIEKAGISLARGDNSAKKIVLISDGQNVGWDTNKPERWEYVAQALEQLPTKPRVVTRFLELPKTFRNIALSSMTLSRAVVGTDR
ncbi:MAG: BatA and WFA domain-containing protein, partial [Pirellulaceae bacterium]|nr:BatA and WFA domain-containing protein [Pirellulaceae bacterium]